MRYNYKTIPYDKPHPAFPNETSTWMPLLPISLSYGHGPKTPRFEALIDSGAADCIFSADIAAHLQIKLKSGLKGETSGIAAGAKIDVYYHEVNLWVVADRIRIKAGFAEGVPMAGILGRRGFFENFIISFDPSATPAGFEIQRLGRA